MTNNKTYQFTNKICGIESIEINKIDKNKFYINHDDSYYNEESCTKEDLLLFIKELENFLKTS
jgi:uncharacterized protein YacL (UPF0231 family)